MSALNIILPAFQAGYGDNQVVVRQRCLAAPLRTALLLYQLTTDPAKREGVDDTEIQYVQRQLEAKRADLRPLLLGLRDQTPYLTRRGTGYGCSGSARGSDGAGSASEPTLSLDSSRTVVDARGAGE